MPLARTLLITLAFALLAAPAHAWQPPAVAGGGDIEVVDPADDAPAYDDFAWPPSGDDAPLPVPGAGLLDDLRDLLPDLGEVPGEPVLPLVTSKTVAGKVARLRVDGKAAVPLGAPKRVRRLISQYNRIVGKRYKWGGGHATLVDSGYDCSGAVGYGLINTGMLATTMVSGSFARWGAAGAGRWVTVYAHRSHVYVEGAGLRLDTSPVGDRGGRSGVRWRPVIGQRRGFKARHPVGL
jgi:hypothetical protein